MSALPKTVPDVDPKRKLVRIGRTSIHKTPTVDVEPIEVDWQVGEYIEWDFGGAPFKVEFKDGNSPFAKATFDETDPVSGPPVKKVRADYKYDLTVSGVTTDPTVVVRP